MRESGILLHISSLPSKYGIGCFDESAYAFADQLKAAKQHVWQILPLGPTGYGDSPYQSFSTFAGNPYFISLPQLIAEGLLTEEECASAETEQVNVDYGWLYETRYPLLRKAFSRWTPDAGFDAFCAENSHWLRDYALFMAIKNAQGGASWQQWPEALKLRVPEALQAAESAYAEDISFYCFLQYKFILQWNKLKEYANAAGIRMLGDIPIYVALDSADSWANPELFQLDEENVPTAVSGCPPDGFAADGQLWGNPLYRWERHAETGYQWWISRISYCFRLYDMLRIDHFRGFSDYFSIPHGDTTARNGHWEKGPGIALFRAVTQALGNQAIVAEDLGYVTDEVRQLVQDSGYPGMKVLEFAFDSRDTGCSGDYFPFHYSPNSVAYTGTHDNATLTGWLGDILPAELNMVRTFLNEPEKPVEALYWDMICAVQCSVSNLCVVPMQDYLGLDHSARMNQPSTSGTNWRWRLAEGQFTPELIERIAVVTNCYGRG